MKEGKKKKKRGFLMGEIGELGNWEIGNWEFGGSHVVVVSVGYVGYVVYVVESVVGRSFTI